MSSTTDASPCPHASATDFVRDTATDFRPCYVPCHILRFSAPMPICFLRSFAALPFKYRWPKKVFKIKLKILNKYVNNPNLCHIKDQRRVGAVPFFNDRLNGRCILHKKNAFHFLEIHLPEFISKKLEPLFRKHSGTNRN